MTHPPTNDLDDVTQDAITHKAPIPPMDLPPDERRAYLGGVFGFRNGTRHTPYSDPDCAAAWYRGWDAARKGGLPGA